MWYNKIKIMNNQKGLSLYLAIMVMGIILAIVFGITTILLAQLESIKGMENSVVAFYAADTGIEKALTQRVNPVVFDGYSETFNLNGTDVSYNIEVLTGGVGNCPATKPSGNPVLFCIKSAGIYKGTQRSIEVKY
jgi:hypothetical protein